MSGTAVTEPIARPGDSAAAIALGVRLVCGFEGFRAAPYQDQADVWTIGYGTIRLQGIPVTADTAPVTEPEARAAMLDELRSTAQAVDASLTGYQPVCVRGALYSFAYNEGVEAERTSTVLKLLNAGDLAGAAEHLTEWNKIHDPVTGALVADRGLTTRRMLERAVMLGLASPP